MPFRIGVTAALLLLAATGGVARAADHPVAVSDNAFAPASLAITQGDTVIWTNPTGGNDHNVWFTTGPAFEMPATATSSWTVQRTFGDVDTFSYRCRIHSTMTGTITVTAAPPGNPPPGNPPPGNPPPGPGDPDPGPGPGGPGELDPLVVTFKVSDATPLAGTRVRLSGEVRPARDGRKVQIQRRGRGGSYRTIATTRLKDAGAAKSKFSIRLRLRGDAVLRARVAGDDERAAGLSRTRSIDVHRRGR
jgi:plastocyanin